jgi:hypothetical protein
MALKFDSKKAEGTFTLLPEGEYECFISEIDHGFSSTGNEMLTVNYTVRDDVEQEGKGQKIKFDRFVNTEAAHWRFHAMNKALKADEGAEWEDFAEWMPFLKGKAVRVIVKHEEATFGKNAGKTFAVANGFKASEVGGEMTFAKDDKPSGSSFEVTDDMLPF